MTRRNYLSRPDLLIGRLRAEWELRRPDMRPAYASPVPRVEGSDPLEVFFPPNAPTLAAAAQSSDVADYVVSILAKLSPDTEGDKQSIFYQWGKAKYGTHWRYADVVTTLRAAALLIRPRTYLEIGVRRGRSAAVVGATCTGCDIYGFDLWIPGYGDAENPGPELVRSELGVVGHTGGVTLVTGDSKQTVPRFFSEHPELFFDLITVDGDHSVSGAMTDLRNVLPRLKLGGILVFDDICRAPLLARAWEALVRRDSRYVTWEFTAAGYGVAAAIRISDVPTLGGPSQASKVGQA